MAKNPSLPRASLLHQLEIAAEWLSVPYRYRDQ